MNEVGVVMPNGEHSLEAIDRRLKELERNMSKWDGWRTGTISALVVVTLLLGAVWKATFSPLKESLEVNRFNIRTIGKKVTLQGDKLSTLITITDRDRKLMDQMDKKLDEAFKKLNYLTPYNGN